MTFLLLSFAMNCCTPPETPLLRGPVPLSHLIIRQFVRGGDHVVDATCGNGNDTLLLALLVGNAGRVWAFDIQRNALEATGAALRDQRLHDTVTLIHAGHETMSEHCPGPVRAVIFNLGYLPGGDRSIITHPETTLAALDQSITILATGGIVAVTVYPGHRGGADEQLAVDAWAGRLEAGRYYSWRMGQLNCPSDAPYHILVQRAS